MQAVGTAWHPEYGAPPSRLKSTAKRVLVGLAVRGLLPWPFAGAVVRALGLGRA